jgi:hypothetical protein
VDTPKGITFYRRVAAYARRIKTVEKVINVMYVRSANVDGQALAAQL